MSDTLPAEQLAERDDADWEREHSQKRVDAAHAFALPLMTRILAIQETWHPDLDTDDDFAALVDQLYDGLRDRLTRQDLLSAFVKPLNVLASKQAKRILAQVQRDVEKLTESEQSSL